MTVTTDPVHEEAVEEFAGRVFAAALGAQEIQAAHLGDRLGWYRALADHGGLTAAGLAAVTSSNERYAREWLEHQAVSGWLTVDDPTVAAEERRYHLPAAHAEVLADPDSLAHLLPLARFIAGAGKHVDRLAEVYRNGGGVSWAELGEDPREGQAAMNRPMFLELFGPEYLPSIPELDALLRGGGRLADIGCGFGWSSIAVARQYPEATVDGFDVDAPSIEAARANAVSAGVDRRVSFAEGDAARLEADGAYDVAMALECVHDMGDPVGVLASMRRMVHDDGFVLVMDERVGDELRAPGGELERFFYGCSITVCLPDCMSHEDSAATGTVLRPAVLRRYAEAAGFSSVEVLPIDNESFRFYRLHL
ncbi:MAG: class I SAM-dependent methyltransferase [Actinomycetota bacterium]|nr:class I SAM-dependent methyltransferase [Actinomycetota bacterium]